MVTSAPELPWVDFKRTSRSRQVVYRENYHRATRGLPIILGEFEAVGGALANR